MAAMASFPLGKSMFLYYSQGFYNKKQLRENLASIGVCISEKRGADENTLMYNGVLHPCVTVQLLDNQGSSGKTNICSVSLLSPVRGVIGVGGKLGGGAIPFFF